jgi:hypothetical protein
VNGPANYSRAISCLVITQQSRAAVSTDFRPSVGYLVTGLVACTQCGLPLVGSGPVSRDPSTTIYVEASHPLRTSVTGEEPSFAAVREAINRRLDALTIEPAVPLTDALDSAIAPSRRRLGWRWPRRPARMQGAWFSAARCGLVLRLPDGSRRR